IHPLVAQPGVQELHQGLVKVRLYFIILNYSSHCKKATGLMTRSMWLRFEMRVFVLAFVLSGLDLYFYIEKITYYVHIETKHPHSSFEICWDTYFRLKAPRNIIF